MPRRSAKTTRQPASTEANPRLIKLQIAATVFVPMLALGLWLTSQGFFG